jgi:membrane fusion protein (multidrug efflux system)
MSSQDFADIETAQQVSKRDYDVAVLQAKADLATARSRSKELDAARQRLADTRMIAPQVGDKPRTGRYAVVKRHVAVGSYVREGDPLFQLIADNPIRFRADIPERFMSTVKVGQAVRLTLEGGTSAEGKVTRINPSIDVASRTFQLEASLDNSSHTLRAGAFVRANIITGQENAATFVPRQSVASFAGVHRVFSVADGKAKEHQVTLGEQRGDYVRVTPNLKNVQNVAMGPVSRLGTGMPVKIDESPAAATASSR